MLKRTFDPKLVYRVVVYLRMSSDQQNKRSPEQQLDEIQKRLKAMGYNWIIVKIYRDDAKSGRYLRKRQGYQQMMQDIKTGVVKVDIILVDTIERFGRVEELQGIRKELYERDGVLVVTGDTNFADPTTPQGRALGMFETMRATEDGRIKAHNVVRGKRDAAQQGHWPGGPPPFGYKLQSVLKEVKGRQEVDHSILVRNPEADWIMEQLFNKARESGWGQTRLARFLNDDPDIPDKFKPFQPPTVGYWLDNPVYSGELVWAQNCTGIVDDMRVVEPNREEDITRVPDFCETIVSREVQEEIWAVRRARREQILQAREAKAGNDGKLIDPPAPGLTLKYLLTGLARCGHCGRAMNPSSTAPYVTKAGEIKTYPAYGCPGYLARVCPNDRRVPEEWLREMVVDTARQRLFPPAEDDSQEPEWLAPLLDDVRGELARQAVSRPDQWSVLERELKDEQARSSGWSMSLAKPDLNPTLRTTIEADWEKSSVHQQEIENLLTESEHQEAHLAEVLNPNQVLERLERLPDVLASNNPTLGNLELSLHIERIDCYRNGRVVMRTCKLGALAGAVDLLTQAREGDLWREEPKVDGTDRVTPRRRARLRVDGGPDSAADLKAAANTAADPNRFAGLGEKWFWEDTFQIPEKTWPFQQMAIEVATERQKGKTHAELAEMFDATPPTIRKALAHAAEVDERFREMPTKMPRVRWHKEHALEVAAKKAEGFGTNELVKHFGKSDTTIRAALEHARKSADQGTQADEAKQP